VPNLFLLWSLFDEETLKCEHEKLLASDDRGKLHYLPFLFQSFDGELERSGTGQNKSLAWAIGDIFTAANFTVAVVAALIGYVLVEFLRKKLQ
jgi:hypothetical protein